MPAVLYESKGPITTITLNRPETRNRIDADRQPGARADVAGQLFADAGVQLQVLRIVQGQERLARRRQVVHDKGLLDARRRQRRNEPRIRGTVVRRSDVRDEHASADRGGHARCPLHGVLENDLESNCVYMPDGEPAARIL